jgi:hypothetical protein
VLDKSVFCLGAYDICSEVPWVTQRDCLTLTEKDLKGVDYFITNPPFARDMLLPIIEYLSSLRPTWLLLPADMMHNRYMKPYLANCSCILSVGRLCWFLDGGGKKVKSVDNFAWYLFDNKSKFSRTEFIGRQ